MKVFLSHKMNGLTDQQVMKIRNKATEYLNKHYIVVEILDNFNHINIPDNAGRVWHLGESIKLMDEADAVYFCDDFTKSNGCQVEYLICQLYGIRVLNDELEEV